MSTLRFSAHCERGHEPVDFTDPAAFEAHMTDEHKARKIGRPGIANPHPIPWKAPKAPRDTRKLTETLAKWQDEPWPTPKRWYGPTGPRHVIGADWETAESSPRTWRDEATA